MAIHKIDKLSVKVTNWVGTPQSIIFHTLFFIIIFTLYLFGVSVESILLILTTAVSLEAIYLAIFIQMTVNRNTRSLKSVEKDIDEIQEDVEDIQEEVDDLGEDVEDITEDIGELQEEEENTQRLEKIEVGLQKLLSEVEALKNHRQSAS